MQLTIYRPGEDEIVYESPTRQLVEESIRNIGDEACVVLSSDDETFIQAVAAPEEPLVLEHQAGSPDAFYVARDEVHSDEVIRAMLSYLESSDFWQQEFQWEQVNLLAYLQADFTMLTYVDTEVLAKGGMIDFEEFYEMPFIGMHHMICLLQILDGGEYNDLEDEFETFGEAEMDDGVTALLHVAPDSLSLSLEQLESDQRQVIAQQWWDSELFPQNVASVADVSELLDEMAKIARSAASQSCLLVVCEVETAEDGEAE